MKNDYGYLTGKDVLSYRRHKPKKKFDSDDFVFWFCVAVIIYILFIK